MPSRKKVTYAFIDATNIIYGAGDNGWRVDFEKLAHFLKTRFSASKIFYYAGVDNENLKQLKFYEKLQDFGFLLRLIPVKTFIDGKKKADVDSRMTFEIMMYFQEYENAVIMTGDGDYYWVIEYLKLKKDKVVLLSFPKHTARELKSLMGGHFMDLNDIKKSLSFGQKNEADPTNVSASRDYKHNISKNRNKVKGK